MVVEIDALKNLSFPQGTSFLTENFLIKVVEKRKRKTRGGGP